jgi:flagellar hook protein FlgE
MFDSINIGMSGLQAFSKGLKVISNNVANLNTPGFKSSDTLFADLYYQTGGAGAGEGGANQTGTGVNALSTYINFKDGETRQTGNPLDMSIDGKGFFITTDATDGSITYGRAGQFVFDKDGILVSRTTGRQVQGYAADGSLGTINLNGLRLNPPRATSIIRFRGNVSTGSATGTPTEFNVEGVKIVDAIGVEHTVRLNFTPRTGANGTWTLAVVDGTTETEAGEIEFAGGQPVSGRDGVDFAYSPAGAATPVNVRFDFTREVTSFAAGATSTLAVSSSDGVAAGTLTQVTFDEEGMLTLKYSNSETATGAQLALATFDSTDALKQTGFGEFVASQDQQAELSRAGSDLVGKIIANQVEVSNVDLSAEFSNLIIMQRGYQASSRVVSTANDMLQVLFDMKGSR